MLTDKLGQQRNCSFRDMHRENDMERPSDGVAAALGYCGLAGYCCLSKWLRRVGEGWRYVQAGGGGTVAQSVRHACFAVVEAASRTSCFRGAGPRQKAAPRFSVLFPEQSLLIWPNSLLHAFLVGLQAGDAARQSP